MRRLTGIATACGAAVCAAPVSPQPAGARVERPLGRAMSRAAKTIAAIVGRDARQIARGDATGAVLAKHCCRTRTLDVYYRSPPSKNLPWHGAYDLRVRSKRRFLESVTVSFFPTQSRWSYGDASRGTGPSYSFTIRSPNRHRGWRFEADDSFFGCGVPSPPSGTCQGLSQAVSFDERQGTGHEFANLYRQALKVSRKAHRHDAISGQNLFTSR